MKKVLIASGIVCGVLMTLFFVLCVLIEWRQVSFGETETGSMEPTYPIGSWTFTDRKATPKIGDVIMFHCAHEDTLCFRIYGTDRIEHRWVSSLPNGCMNIIGDNPKYADLWRQLPCFPPEDIVIEGVSHKLWF